MEDAARTKPLVCVPASWLQAPAVDEAVVLAARACRETAALAGWRTPFAFVTAICQLTEEHLATSDEDAALFLSLTARMLDATAEKIGGDDVEAVLFASACRRCAGACRTALVSLSLDED